MEAYLKQELFGEENYKENLFKLFDFDADVTGQNGKEYTDQEAIDNGYKTTLEMFIGEAEKVKKDFKEVVIQVVEEFISYAPNVGYYDVMKYATVEIDNKLVVSVVAAYGD